MTGRLLFEGDALVRNRRDDPRIDTQEEVRLHGVQPQTCCDGTVQNVSSRGLRLHSAEAFAAGSTLVVEWNSGYLPAHVRHCRAIEDGWLIGVEVEMRPGSAALLDGLKRSALDRNRSQLAVPRSRAINFTVS
jgi:hypothetical protein